MAQTWDELRTVHQTYHTGPAANRKLTDEQASEIRQRFYGDKVSSGRLAREYGVNENTIIRLLAGFSYRGVYKPVTVACISRAARNPLPLGALCPVTSSELHTVGSSERTAAHDTRAAFDLRLSRNERENRREAPYTRGGEGDRCFWFPTGDKRLSAIWRAALTAAA